MLVCLEEECGRLGQMYERGIRSGVLGLKAAHLAGRVVAALGYRGDYVTLFSPAAGQCHQRGILLSGGDSNHCGSLGLGRVHVSLDRRHAVLQLFFPSTNRDVYHR